MRTKTQAKFESTNYEWTAPAYTQGGQRLLSDALEDMLAWESLDFVEIHHKSGMVTRYYHWEYECEWCESYDHKTDDCPERDDGIECPNCTAQDRQDCIEPHGH